MPFHTMDVLLKVFERAEEMWSQGVSKEIIHPAQRMSPFIQSVSIYEI